MKKKKNPLVFMDVSIDGDPVERMIFELFPDVAPKTAENFRALCTGEKGIGPKTGKLLHFKGSFFHRIIQGLMAQGGDFHKRDGSSGESIYGEKFPDESPKLKHEEPGLLSMSIADRDDFGSHFGITFKANHHLDRKSVVFGKLVRGHEVLKRIENVGDKEGKPTVTVKIINCGELSEDKKKANKLKIAKDPTFDVSSNEVRRKGKYKKSSRDRRKKRKRYYSSDSESSSDIETETSESDSDSDSYLSSSSDLSCSSDDRCKRRKKSSKRDRYKCSKRWDKHRDRKRKRRDKKSKHKSRRVSSSPTDTVSETGSSSEDNSRDARGEQPKDVSAKSVCNLLPLAAEKEVPFLCENGGDSPKENGQQRVNGIEEDGQYIRSPNAQPDEVDDHPGKSRSRSMSPGKDVNKDTISPRSMNMSSGASPRSRVSRSRSIASKSPSPPSRRRSGNKSPIKSGKSRSPAPSKKFRSISRSSVEAHSCRSDSRSPPRSISPRSLSRSPPSKAKNSGIARASRSISRSRSSMRRSISRSPVRSSRRSLSGSLVKSARKSISRSPVRSSRRSISRSPVRSTRSISRSPPRSTRRSISRSPVRSRRSPSRSPVRSRRRSMSRSPVQASWRSISRSPVRPSRRSISRSPARSSRRSISKSPVRSSKRSISRSPVRTARRSISWSPLRTSRRSKRRGSGRPPSRRSISRSLSPPVRQARSPPSDRRRSYSRSISPDGLPKRIKRGRGFSEHYAYARCYRTPSPDPPVRSYRHRDRYSSYRRYSPRRYRSPPRGRTSLSQEVPFPSPGKILFKEFESLCVEVFSGLPVPAQKGKEGPFEVLTPKGKQGPFEVFIFISEPGREEGPCLL
ncbi:hypothetical protein CDL15_Pgr017430 [Punica granatum]|uniref:peptidylprolyl isomerase n=1 Tax=Punica granatum TaxID=22663 RepID=A0A218WQQ1_PUNGR|nr:hypothetical protein CDL15_Pgr017430 [Punica granatum]